MTSLRSFPLLGHLRWRSVRILCTLCWESVFVHILRLALARAQPIRDSFSARAAVDLQPVCPTAQFEHFPAICAFSLCRSNLQCSVLTSSPPEYGFLSRPAVPSRRTLCPKLALTAPEEPEQMECQHGRHRRCERGLTETIHDKHSPYAIAYWATAQTSRGRCTNGEFLNL